MSRWLAARLPRKSQCSLLAAAALPFAGLGGGGSCIASILRVGVDYDKLPEGARHILKFVQDQRDEGRREKAKRKRSSRLLQERSHVRQPDALGMTTDSTNSHDGRSLIETSSITYAQNVCTDDHPAKRHRKGKERTWIGCIDRVSQRCLWGTHTSSLPKQELRVC